MRRERRIFSFLLASANRQELALLIRLLGSIGLDAGRGFPKCAGPMRKKVTNQ